MKKILAGFVLVLMVLASTIGATALNLEIPGENQSVVTFGKEQTFTYTLSDVRNIHKWNYSFEAFYGPSGWLTYDGVNMEEITDKSLSSNVTANVDVVSDTEATLSLTVNFPNGFHINNSSTSSYWHGVQYEKYLGRIVAWDAGGSQVVATQHQVALIADYNDVKIWIDNTLTPKVNSIESIVSKLNEDCEGNMIPQENWNEIMQPLIDEVLTDIADLENTAAYHSSNINDFSVDGALDIDAGINQLKESYIEMNSTFNDEFDGTKCTYPEET
ncbi:MAG: hypothetical protein ABH821_04010 [archaeon]